MTTTTKRTYSAAKQKVPPFARFKGTSVWRQFKLRAREYAIFKATQAGRNQTRAA